MKQFILVIAILSGLLFACGGEQKPKPNSEPQVNNAPVEKPQEKTDSPEDLVLEAGKKVYDQYCIVCHQADGQGVPNAFPPLVKTEWVLGDKEQLIAVVLNGLSGEIEVNGETYNSAMLPHDFLTDDDIAAVITYVRSSFGNDAEAVTAQEVADVRASS
ncbi:MAG: c-type cytochrome [Cyclobacteriaceae bacterium]|nr:c-type cytochrome [Cyclobacteriaceae bacterium]